MGQTDDWARRRRTSIDGFAFNPTKNKSNKEPKEHIKEIMGKQKILDTSGDDRHTDTSRPVVQQRKRNRLVAVPLTVLTTIKSFFVKGIDKLKLFVYNVYCSIHKRKDNIMSKDNNNKPQGTQAKKATKKQPNAAMSGIITIGIALAWVSAAYCVVLVNTGTGSDMFPKYASIPLAAVLAGTFLVAIYKTIKNTNR